MKQILITREQLYRIFAEENGKIASETAKEADDFWIGMLLTNHVVEVTNAVFDRLFGKENVNV